MAFALFVASCIAIPISTTIQSQNDAIPPEDRKILVITPDQALEVIPLGPEPPKEDGEMMDTANAMVYRPLFAYRRIQQRKYRYPLRRSGYYASEDRFPTLA